MLRSGFYGSGGELGRPSSSWGVTMLPNRSGGSGEDVTNGIVAAGDPATRHPEAVRQGAGLAGHTATPTWAGAGRPSRPHTRPSRGTSTTGRPGAWTSRRSRSWTARASPHPAVRVSPPGTRRSHRSSTRCSGRRPVAETLAAAQQAANTAGATLKGPRACAGVNPARGPPPGHRHRGKHCPGCSAPPSWPSSAATGPPRSGRYRLGR